MPTAVETDPGTSVLNFNFLSHGTMASRDLDATRKFYEEFLGLEVIRTSPISIAVRLGGNHVYAVVLAKDKPKMAMLEHNGLDLESQDEVNHAHEVIAAEAEKWGITGITRPALQHATYSFFFWDLDDNCWEVLTNPKGGYVWMFDKGDQAGRGHLDKTFERPGMTEEQLAAVSAERGEGKR
jgi:catechol 2,3-dioxygenase-like lactoylglutathione lyase family enzyme